MDKAEALKVINEVVRYYPATRENMAKDTWVRLWQNDMHPYELSDALEGIAYYARHNTHHQKPTIADLVGGIDAYVHDADSRRARASKAPTLESAAWSVPGASDRDVAIAYQHMIAQVLADERGHNPQWLHDQCLAQAEANPALASYWRSEANAWLSSPERQNKSARA